MTTVPVGIPFELESNILFALPPFRASIFVSDVNADINQYNEPDANVATDGESILFVEGQAILAGGFIATPSGPWLICIKRFD